MADRPTMEEKRARLALALERLRAEFEQGLPARVQELRAQVASFRPEGDRHQAAEIAAHSLAGIAGSFGRQALTDAAARLEEGLVGALGTAPEAWPARARELAGLLAELELAANLPGS